MTPFRPFPIHTLPDTIRRFVIEHARAIGCDDSLVALPTIAALASAIGNSTVVHIKRGWTEPAVVFAAIVMRSGGSKTPALDAALAPIRLREEKAIADYQAALAQHAEETQRWEVADKKTRGQAPLPPTCMRFTVEDITVEALAVRLRQNPRGLLAAHDELSGFFGSFNKYRARGMGSDESQWLKLFHARTLCVDRKSDGAPMNYVPRANASVVGGVQPRILGRVLTDQYFENGLAARLLVTYPPFRISTWTDAEPDPDVDAAVATIYDRLYGLPLRLNLNNAPDPRCIYLSAGARRSFVAFYDQHNREILNLDEDESAAWKKLEGYCPRLAMILHLAEWASTDTSAEPGPIAASTMEAAIELTRWFSGEALRVYAMLRESDEDRADRELMDLIRLHGGRITVRDLQRGPRRFRGNASAAEAALRGLAKAGRGYWQNVPPGSAGGHPICEFVLADSPAAAGGDGDTTPVLTPEMQVLSPSPGTDIDPRPLAIRYASCEESAPGWTANADDCRGLA